MVRTYYKYSVPPYSKVPDNTTAFKFKTHQEPCAICGRPVNEDGHQFFGIVTDGGSRWADDFEDGGGGNMGGFAVGNDCHRKYVIKGWSYTPEE